MALDTNCIPGENCRVFIHIGYPRTATTCLQNVVFPSIPNIVYYKKFMPLKMYTRTGNVQYKHEVLDNLALKEWEQKPVLYSDEGLIASGPIFQLYNLKNIFPNAHIIITVRSQVEQIISRYKQMVKRGAEYQSLRKYFSGRRKYRIIGFLSYYSLLKFIDTIYRDNWSVYFFEEYKNNFDEMVIHLGRLFHADSWSEKINIKEISNAQSKNLSVNSTLLLLRFLNFFGLIRKSQFGNKAADVIVKVGTYVDDSISKEYHLMRKEKDKAMVTEKSQGAFLKQNKELEALLLRKLPSEYFITSNNV